MKKVTVHVEEETWEALRVLATTERRSRGEFVRLLLEDAVSGSSGSPGSSGISLSTGSSGSGRSGRRGATGSGGTAGRTGTVIPRPGSSTPVGSGSTRAAPAGLGSPDAACRHEGKVNGYCPDCRKRIVAF